MTSMGQGNSLREVYRIGTRIWPCNSTLETSATAFRFTEYDDVSAFWWKNGPLAYVLIGQGERDRLLPLTRATYQELNP